MNSLLSEYVHSRKRVRDLTVERDEGLATINRYVVDPKRVLRPFIFVTMRRQVDALVHRKSIQDSFQPSSIMIRTGENARALFDAVTVVRLGCRVRIASSRVRNRTTKDYRKYQSLYYALRVSVEALEEEYRRCEQLYKRFRDANVVKVSNGDELNALIYVKNSGGWRANTIVIPTLNAFANVGALEQDIEEAGFVFLLGDHADAQ
ncbi:uncharacterized protein LOC110752693 [Prunus avium]|uniref:Uncharacterized protein LOC110752693 n=1 Tax=Prunus avium TaxID=42229 RepID=A0A6P5S349_PRUAV|nr:uncharacterized protein LOC110752693 [Prunus avium]